MASRNKNGIAVVVTPPPPRECVNTKNHKPKMRFYSRFEAERYIAEIIRPPERRARFHVYECNGHYHLTTLREAANGG